MRKKTFWINIFVILKISYNIKYVIDSITIYHIPSGIGEI